MNKPRYFLLLAITVLGLGCYMVIDGKSRQPDEWPMYLGIACMILSICVAALVEALQALHKRIEQLEQKLASRSPEGDKAPGS